jgi:outer membrane biosynthesis protein TonB
MKSLFAIVVALALSYSLMPVVWAQNQQPSPESRRRVVRRVAPEYPLAAKRIGLGGTVKVVALVGTDGSVKRVEPVGGSPILMQAAQTAITQWKYAPGSESQESVELHFTP